MVRRTPIQPQIANAGSRVLPEARRAILLQFLESCDEIGVELKVNEEGGEARCFVSESKPGRPTHHETMAYAASKTDPPRPDGPFHDRKKHHSVAQPPPRTCFLSLA